MSTGSLYIVATPIGNLKDITYRAVDVLKQVDIIAAEDTRHSRKLLDHYGVETKMVAVHDHNEDEKISFLSGLLKEGKSVALISDAGTPLISDPGFRLVRSVRESGYEVVAVPGACAAIAALSIAGLPTDCFYFVGFLAPKQQARRAQLERYANQRATLVLYEAPRRIVDCITDVELVMGEGRTLALVKEITKTFEACVVGSAADLRQWLLAEEGRQKGEFVLLVEGSPEHHSGQVIDASVLRALNLAHQSMSLKKACALISELTGVAKNALYEAALAKTKQ